MFLLDIFGDIITIFENNKFLHNIQNYEPNPFYQHIIYLFSLNLYNSFEV